MKKIIHNYSAQTGNGHILPIFGRKLPQNAHIAEYLWGICCAFAAIFRTKACPVCFWSRDRLKSDSFHRSLLGGEWLQMILRALIVSFLLCGLTACGFQLRGHQTTAQPFKAIYLQMDNPYGSLESKLRQTLQGSGVRLVENPAQAPLTLHLYTSSTTNTNAMIGPSSQSRSYTLTYTVTYVLLDAKRSISLPPETLQASRNLILSANQLPQSNNQIAVLNREMERDIIRQLYNRLHSAEIEKVFLARH